MRCKPPPGLQRTRVAGLASKGGKTMQALDEGMLDALTFSLVFSVEFFEIEDACICIALDL